MKGVVIEQKAFEKLLSKINLLTDAINFINQTIQKRRIGQMTWLTGCLYGTKYFTAHITILSE